MELVFLRGFEINIIKISNIIFVKIFSIFLKKKRKRYRNEFSVCLKVNFKYNLDQNK